MTILAIRSRTASLSQIAPLMRPLIAFQPKKYFHQSQNPMQAKCLADRALPFKYKTLIAGLAVTGMSLYLVLNHLQEEEESHLQHLFAAVDQGDFEKAKILIDSGHIDINAERKSVSGDRSYVILESFFPKTEKELDHFMDFIDFVLSRNYKHLNRSIGGKPGGCNLLTNIYDRQMFKEEPRLRRKLASFLLQKGVDPMHKGNFNKSPLIAAACSGDAKFFIKTCMQLCHPVFLELMSDDDSCVMLGLSIVGGHVEDLDFLLEQGAPLGQRKPKLLQLLNEYSRIYPEKDFTKAQEILSKPPH